MAQDVEIIKPWIKVGESKSEYKVDDYPQIPFLGVYKGKAIREYLLEFLHGGVKLVKKISCFCVLTRLKEMDWGESHSRAYIGKFREEVFRFIG
jgi:hypothetical protein